MLDELVKKFTRKFQICGDPRIFPNRYSSKKEELEAYEYYYSGYQAGLLREYVALGGMVPMIEEEYHNDIDDLISKINSTEDLKSIEVIFINNEITDISHLEKLKKAYPDKAIIIYWNYEPGFIDNVISAEYMIKYYKSVMDENFSALEKVAMAYDIVKSHMYKEAIESMGMNDKYLTLIVNNDSIVCHGFASLFSRLLKEMEFDASVLGVVTTKGSDANNHSRNLVRIIDQKYNINGLYAFDATWDSSDKEHYHLLTEELQTESSKKKEGYQKADPLASYKYFLVPIQSYEKVFGYSQREKILSEDKPCFDEQTLQGLLHTNQNKEDRKALSTFSFVNLLYKIKLAEGYSEKEIPKLIQESLFISKYGYYSLEKIQEMIQFKSQRGLNK